MAAPFGISLFILVLQILYGSSSVSDEPTLSCPSSFEVLTDPGENFATVNYTYTVDSGNSDPADVTINYPPNSELRIGMKVVTINVENSANLSTSCSFEITIKDEEPPQILGCPNSTEVRTALGESTVSVEWTPPTATDNAGTPALASAINPGHVFPIGTTAVTYIAVDANSNGATCIFNVTVLDLESPNVTFCPPNITESIAGMNTMVSWTEPSFEDNSGMVTPDNNYSPGDSFPIGGTEVIYNAADPSGNLAVCSFFVIVSDMEAPTFQNCPTESVMVSYNPMPPSGNLTAASWPDITATDNDLSINVTVTSTYQSGDVFPLGTTLVNVTAVDDYGNTALCQFDVVVFDDEIPVVTPCPDNIEVTINTSASSILVDWISPNLTDNVAIKNGTVNYFPNSSFPIGTWTVEYIGIDTSDNIGTCEFNVTVLDGTPPVFTVCPAPITTSTDPGVMTKNLTVVAVAQDNSGEPTVTATSDTSNFPVGTSYLVFEAVDSSGNVAICNVSITVEDDEAPTFPDCPMDQSVPTISGMLVAMATWMVPTAVDNVGNPATTNSHKPGRLFPLGPTTVTYNATDEAGNTGVCEFEILVYDDEIPVITCPSNVTEMTDPNKNSTSVTWGMVIVSDNEGGLVASSDFNSGDVFEFGFTEVIYSVSDSAGNNASCSFFVTIEDNQAPVFENCTSSFVVYIPDGVAPNITWTEPVATDNVAIVSLNRSSEFPIPEMAAGSVEVVYVVEDLSGLTTECRFTITVEDNVPPVLTCPPDITADTSPGVSYAAVNFTDASVEGDYTLLTRDFEPFSNFSIGTATVTFEAIDASGNMGMCSFDITVEDNEKPMITNCPEDITFTASLNFTAVNATWTPPNITDNSGNVVVVPTADPGTEFGIGTTIVTYVAVDGSGNREECSFSVRLIDNEQPVFSNCPMPEVVYEFTDPGVATVTYTWTEPTVSDNFGPPAVSSTHTSPFMFPLGNTTVEYTATDSSTNVATCSFTIVVTDNEDPVWMNCPENITTEAQNGTMTANMTWTVPSVTDNHMVSSMSSTSPPGTFFMVGNTTVTYEAQDPAGNVAVCMFVVTVLDPEPPTFSNCPSSFTYPTDPGLSFAFVNFTEPVAADNSGDVSVVASATSGSQFNLGDTPVDYTATDGVGLTETCSFTITVEDSESPVFDSCPDDIYANLDAGAFQATVNWAEPVAQDNVGVIFQNRSHDPNTVFQEGTTTVVYRAYDAVGYVGICSFNVIVTDIEPPTIQGCRTLMIQSALSTANYSTSVFWLAPTATDRFPPINVTNTHDPFDRFYIGYTDVVYTFTDSNGNQANCTFQVLIQDNTPPVYTNCPVDMTVAPDSGNVTAVLTWTEPTVTDNSGSVDVTTTATPPTAFPPGDTNVMYSFIDPSGNPAFCSFTVTVEDTEFPVFTTCPNDETTTNSPNQPYGVATWVEPTATDNTIPPVVVATHYSGDNFTIGVTEVVYTATDAYGLQVNCSFTVTVIDNEDPTLDGCPNDITENAPFGSNEKNVTWMVPTASDNSGSVTVQESHPPGSTFSLGPTPVTYNFMDPSGNPVICSFDVTILDVTNPTFVNCPANMTVPTDANEAFATVNWTPPTATDESGTPMVTSSASPGAQFPIGPTLVTYSAIDSSNNPAECTFTVTVEDEELPVITGCPNNVTLSMEAGENTAIATWNPPSASDNDPGFTFNSNINLGERLTLGVAEVIYLAEDPSGNTETCSFFVSVMDDEAPTFLSCPSDNTTGTDVGQSYATVLWTPPTAQDNNMVTINSNYDPGDQFSLGETEVVYVAEDPSGNIDECRFTVTVMDDEFPVFMNCPESFSVGQDPGQTYGTINWTEPTVSDNVNITFYYQSMTPPDQLELGSRNVLYVARDAANNVATCSFIASIVDITPPTITYCPNTVIKSTTLGTDNNIVFWVTPTANSERGSVSVVSTHEPLDTFYIGTTSVVYTFTDSAGNAANCTFDVIMQDNELPTIEGCPSNFTFAPDPMNLNTTVNWTEPVISDNSMMETVQQTHTPPILLQPGITEVLYFVMDPSGNTAECRFYIGITDKDPPTFTSCPSDITRITDENQGYASNVTWEEPPATDNTLPPTVTSAFTPGQNFTIGTHTVTYTAVDAFALTATCSFVVTIQDIEDPVLSNCPGTMTVNLPPDNSTALVSWMPPTSFDNSGSEVVTSNRPLPSLLPLGLTEVVLTATDPSGNQDSCSFTVAVRDVSPPVYLTCPNDTTVFTMGSSKGTASWPIVLAIDNSGLPSMTTTHSPGDFPIGVTQVTYMATDQSGNRAMCIFNVTVIDDDEPQLIGCPDDIDITLGLGNSTIPVTWTPPNATDNSVIVSLEVTASPNSEFGAGETNVTYTAEDDSGNMASCTFKIVVHDNELPTITNCPSDKIRDTLPQFNYTYIMWEEPFAMDNDGIASFGVDSVNGSMFTVGNTTVTYTAVDISGNEATCSFLVTVRGCSYGRSVVFTVTCGQCGDSCKPAIQGELGQGYQFFCDAKDNTPPVAIQSCSGPITLVLPPDDSEVNVTWPEPVFRDNVGVVSVSSTLTPGFYGFGDYQVTFTAIDEAQNEGYCSFPVVIQDKTAPVITGCPSTQTLRADPGNSTTTVNWTEPDATDNSLEVNVSSTHVPPAIFSIGITKVTYTFVDVAGNEKVCSFNVVVEDDELPVIFGCPDDIAIEPDQGYLNGTANWTEPVATDNSGNVSLTSNFMPPAVFEKGTYPVTYTAVDASGNTDNCSFTVTVQDTIPPQFTSCPSNVTVTLDDEANSTVVNWTVPDAVDNSIPPQVVSTYAPGDILGTGKYEVVYTATDASSLSAMCSFFVTVIDDEDPVFIDCPEEDTYIVVQPGENSALVNWTDPVVTDNNGVIASYSSNYNSPQTFMLGIAVVTYTAIDSSGNNARCSFRFIVTDDEPPTFNNCPEEDMVIHTDPGLPTATIHPMLINVTDNSGTPLVTIDQPGNRVALGNTVVTFWATDASGNNATCTFTISVLDDEPPTLNCSDFSTNETNAVRYPLPDTADNVGVTSTTASIHPGSVFPEGATPVTFTAFDASGNNASCTFDVIVAAGERPVVTGCPSNINMSIPFQNDSVEVLWTEPSATVFSGPPANVNKSHEPGSIFPVGVTTVRYSFTDNAGLETVCTFDVIVIRLPDLLPPIFDNCPVNVTELAPVGFNFTHIDLTMIIAADDSLENVTVIASRDLNDPFEVGSEVVFLTATDSSGNSINCTFEVIVIQDEVPVFDICPNETIVTSMIPGANYATVTWPEITASDESGPVMVVNIYESPTNFTRGTYTISNTALDDTSNTASCNFFVTVEDNEAPVLIDCPEEVVVYVPENATSGVANWTVPTAVDNDVLIVLKGSEEPNAEFSLGISTESYTAVDRSKNRATCYFNVSIITDLAPLFLDCPSNVSIDSEPGLATANSSWDMVNITDDSPGDLTIVESVSPGTFSIGDTEVVISASDSVGNVARCIFTITVVDVEDPEILGCPDKITGYVPDGESFSASWTAPNVTDNSGAASLSSNFAPGASFLIGSHEVIYTATDNAGGTDTCSFYVTVGVDSPPTFENCTSSFTVNTDLAEGFATPTWDLPFASDDLGDVNVTSTYSPGDEIDIGMTTVTYTATDYNGQEDECTFTVTVGDQEKPVITDCPNDFTATILPNMTMGPVSWTPPSAMDNSGMVTLTSGLNPGDTFGLGTSSVTYIAVDPSSNFAQCAFDILVEEDQPPRFSGCPPNQEVGTTVGETFAVGSWTPPTAKDAESEPTVTSNFELGDLFEIGNTTVQYVAMDSLGQTATCEFVLIVTDMEPPVFANCPENQTIVIPFNQSPTIVSWVPPLVTDNDQSGNISVTSTNMPQDTFAIGTHTVTYTATDASGNEATCSFDITVEEDDPPVIQGCPDDITVDNSPGKGFASVNWVEPTAYDNNSMPMLMSEYAPGSMFDIGVTEVVYTATDNLGSQSTCTFMVTVRDIEDPVLDGCPTGVELFVQSMDLDAALYWQVPTATDNSGEFDLTSSHELGERRGVGSIRVQYTASDAASNVDRCSFKVSVQVKEGDASSGQIVMDRVRGMDAPFTNTSGFDSTIAEDLDDIFRRSDLAPNFLGVVVDSVTIDEDDFAKVALTLFSDTEAALEDSDFEDAFDANLGGVFGNMFDISNKVPEFREFFVGDGPCEDACQNGGNCTRLNRDEYVCDCPPEWTGQDCDVDVDECEEGFCPDEKVCTNYEGGFTCECPVLQFEVNGNCLDVKQFSGIFDIYRLDNENVDFSEELSNPLSPEYMELVQRVVEALDDVFKDDPTFMGSRVTRFESGSIRVFYLLSFLVSSPTTDGEVTDMFNRSIVTAGEISGDTDIFVEPLDGMSHEICAEGYCLNEGECSADPESLNSICDCPGRFIGDRCEYESPLVPIYIIVLASLAIFLFLMTFFLCCICCALSSHPKVPVHHPAGPSIFSPTPTIVDTGRSALYPEVCEAPPVYIRSARRKHRHSRHSRKSRRDRHRSRRERSLYDLNDRRSRHVDRNADLYYNSHGFDNLAAATYDLPPTQFTHIDERGREGRQSVRFATPYVATGQEEALLHERMRNTHF